MSELFMFPLSVDQQRLWVIDQLAKGTPSYNITSGARLSGLLNVDALERSLEEVVRRHENLRTRFAIVEGQPVQIVSQEINCPLVVRSLAELPQDQKEENVRQFRKQETRWSFDLEHGPLVRTNLLKVSEREHILLFTMHHIVGDAWSMRVLTQEVIALYEAFASGMPSQLENLPIQYADFSVWQQTWLQSKGLETELSYWKQKLQNLPPVLELPTDRPRPAVQSDHGSCESLLLSTSLTRSLDELTRQEGLTMFMAMLAAFNVLLSRYSGSDDIFVGTPISGRNRTELEALIGFFVNTIVIRTDLSCDPTFRDTLKRLKQVVLEAHEHKDLPFAMLVEHLHPDRNLSHAPLFQVMFTYEKDTPETLKVNGLNLDWLEGDTSSAKFDLTVSVAQAADRLKLAVEYNTDLFDASTIQRMMRHYENLLESAMRNPDQKLWELEMLSEAEREEVLVEWNRTERAYERDSTIQEQFYEQVRRRGIETAIEVEGERVSYEELNRRTNQLARYLRKKGVREEARVGICEERGIGMVEGMLGIVKAGGAYVPMEPSYPVERLKQMIEDGEIGVVLSRSELGVELEEDGVEMVKVDEERGEIEKESGEDLEVEGGGESLAYVMYTSGSTGKPKGVSVTHRGVVRLVKNTEYVKLDEEEVILQYAPMSFDAATFEIWGGLLNGGKVAIARAGRQTVEELGEEIKSKGVTTMWLTSALFAQMVEMNIEGLKGVRQLVAGGDVLPVEQSMRVVEEVEGCRLINGYGPTEGTTFTCSHEVRREERGRQTIPIGKPIGNTRVYILGRQMEAIGEGVPGEIYIGGDGLARGYWKEAGLTAEKFVPDPYSEVGGERLYKTGDIGKYGRGGEIEFMGRADDQVKIRGFRIEPGEIETIIEQYQGVRDCVVVTREEASGGKRLVAYVATPKASGLSISELRGFLKKKMPEYMVPNSFVLLQELPLTSNGKIDRQALPAPDQIAIEGNSGYAEPQTPIQEMLAAIWSEVLETERVGIHSNFFDMGGHSLLAMQIISRLKEVFKIDVPLRTLFERPTIAELADIIESSSRVLDLAEAPRIERVNRDACVPLSYSQQRLWFLHQLSPNDSVYNIHYALELTGDLDVTSLRNALNEVVRRHEALRTLFSMAEGQPVQVIGTPEGIDLRLTDLSWLNDQQREAEALRLIKEDSTQPFDLAKGPMVRAQLLDLSGSHYILLITMHHIVSDGWSMQIFIREMTTIYASFRDGKKSPLPEPALQYADFAVWQRKWLQGEVLERQMRYWKQRLGDAQPVLELPADRPRPALQSYRGAYEKSTLSEDLGYRVKRLSRQEGVTVFMTLLAGFKLLLARYSGREDITIGTPIANRNHAATEALMGFFANTLVIRTDLRGKPSFREVLKGVREGCLGAYAHQDIPFEKLVDVLEPNRDPSHTPLFQVMFSYEKDMTQLFNVSGLELKWLEGATTSAKFDLTMSVTEAAEGLSLGIEYNTDLFEATSIVRMMTHYTTLLDAAVSEPERAVWELEMLRPHEREEVLSAWNQTARDFDASRSIQKQFYEQAKRRARDVAIEWDGGRMSYEELNRRTNQLARYLITRGVSEETRVGICEARGVWMVVEMLAILKAGGAYVPLEPSYPGERLRQMIEDADVRLILSSGDFGAVVEGEGRSVVKVDEQWEKISRHSDENLEIEGSVQSLAYVMYTSGSTGKPKAVGIPYGAMLNHLNWMAEAYPLADTDRVVQKYPFSFDVSVLEVFCTFLAGARLVIARPEGHKDSSYLVDLIVERGITTIDVVPTMLRALLDEERFVKGNSLRRVISGGEVLPVSLQDRFFDCMQAELHNLYGPTEAAISSTFFQCKPDSLRAAVPIGRPIANTKVYILDRHLQPLPVGVPGELYIGGMGLARGYINDSSLTAERFIPDPFGESSGSRLYRSGDLARYGAAGEIEYCGRIDHQVKVRGYRIELAEIESVILQCRGVQDCAVVARSLPQREQRLLAYLVVKPGIDLNVKEIREYLTQKLPDYMVPNSYSVLETMPLDANGKIDQRALPEPEDTNLPYRTARTPIEEILTGIWSEVLEKEQVGIDEDFFEIGGHSLLATRVNSWIREALGVELNVGTLFESPTIRELGERIEIAMRDPEVAQAPRIQRTSPQGRVSLSFAQQRLWFLNQLEPDSPFYNVPFGVRLTGCLDVRALKRSLSEIVRRHEVLRTIFITKDGEPAQIITPDLALELPIVDLTGLSESMKAEETSRLSESVSRRTFDISVGPLLRSVVLRLEEQEHVALMTMHHLVSDEWSMGVLVKEIGALYEAFTGNLPSPLPELQIQYSDFAAWQREWLDGEVLEKQLTHWKKQLQQLPPPMRLSSKPRPERDSYHRAAHQIELPQSLSRRLKKLCAQEKATLFMTMLAAFKVLLYRYSGQEQIVVGAPIANRNHAEIEALIGFFINTLVLKTDLGGDPSFRDVLRKVKDVCLMAYAHQDLPFEKLVDELAPERSLNYAPLFQVMFVLQNAPISSVELPGLTITPVKTDTGAAMFDLILIATDAGECIQGMWLYNTDLFDSSTVRRIAEHYVTVIEEAVENPGVRIIDIPISNELAESGFSSTTNIENRYEAGSFNF